MMDSRVSVNSLRIEFSFDMFFFFTSHVLVKPFDRFMIINSEKPVYQEQVLNKLYRSHIMRV